MNAECAATEGWVEREGREDLEVGKDMNPFNASLRAFAFQSLLSAASAASACLSASSAYKGLHR
jgi:hypothetical protein